VTRLRPRIERLQVSAGKPGLVLAWREVHSDSA
jgi:hypothetical protein